MAVNSAVDAGRRRGQSPTPAASAAPRALDGLGVRRPRSSWSSCSRWSSPIGYAIYLSLFRQQLIGGNAFVGLRQLHGRRSSDPQFWASLRAGALFLVVQVPVMLVLALLAALALDSARLHWAPLYRLSIFLPYAVPAVVASLMWGFIYGDAVRPASPGCDRCSARHLPDPLSSNWVLASIGNIVTWEFVGYNMLIFYSALRAVPAELYEAAEIDGAGAVRDHPAGSSCPRCGPAIVVAADLLGHRQLPAVQRAEHPALPDRPNTIPATSRRTCTPTTCRSPARSTTTRRRSPSSWAS